jgi:hypothetical protein
MNRFRILCEVSGGVTGHREGYFKENGKVVLFTNEEKAKVYADKLAINANTTAAFTVANYRYTVEDYLTSNKPTNFSVPESLEVVWAALHGFREDCIPEGDPTYDEEWDNITLAMAWITEALEADKPLTGAELLATHTYKGQEALDLD